MGYQVVPKENLPHKIWTACIHCEKFSNCDEFAMVKNISSASTETAPIFEVDQA